VLNRLTSRKRIAAVVVVFALALGSVSSSQAETDTREIKAREDFAAGRFQEALDIFARLYAETLHPIYLRNIGRCYQNLGNPDRAIATFHDYLRKATKVSPAEQKEIEGFIKEMEDLKRQRESAAHPTAEAPATAASTTAAPPAPEPAAPASSTQAVLVSTPEPAAPAESQPIYTKWWFWTLIGAAVVGAGVGIAAATGALDRPQDATCPMGFSCPR
jgi:tetratricopeptide (TPR) repeat protein